MKLLSLYVLLLFSIAFRAPECVCVKETHPSEEKIKADRQQAFDKATAVFEGKVVALNPYTVTLRLQKRWKGPSQNEIVLSMGAVPGFDGTPLPEECSYQFQLGEEYLVYAYGPAERLKTSACDTLTIKNAAEEEQGLDQIKQHETLPRNQMNRHGDVSRRCDANKECTQCWERRRPRLLGAVDLPS
jgi:hypothetical protein